MTLKIPSSVRVGSRFRIETIFWYSLSVIPCCSSSSSVTINSPNGVSSNFYERLNHRFENKPAVGTAEDCFARAVRVRHHPQNIPVFIHNARDVMLRAVWIFHVPEHHL